MHELRNAACVRGSYGNRVLKADMVVVVAPLS